MIFRGRLTRGVRRFLGTSETRITEDNMLDLLARALGRSAEACMAHPKCPNYLRVTLSVGPIDDADVLEVVVIRRGGDGLLQRAMLRGLANEIDPPERGDDEGATP